MKKGLFLSILITSLIFFVSFICFAASDSNKGSGNSNKQLYESSTRGEERVEQRHQVKEEKEYGREVEKSVDDDDDDSEVKEKKKGKETKNTDDYDSDDEDNKKDDDSDDEEGGSSDDESHKEKKSRR